MGGPHRSKLVLASEPVEVQQLLISLCRFMTCSRLTEVRSLIFCHVNSNFGSVNYLLKGGGGWELKTRNELSPKSCQIFKTEKFVFSTLKRNFGLKLRWHDVNWSTDISSPDNSSLSNSSPYLCNMTTRPLTTRVLSLLVHMVTS